jgi:hypothetical protein
LHLVSVLDMASRRVVGFALGEHHTPELACGALAMAVAVRGGHRVSLRAAQTDALPVPGRVAAAPRRKGGSAPLLTDTSLADFAVSRRQDVAHSRVVIGSAGGEPASDSSRVR